LGDPHLPVLAALLAAARLWDVLEGAEGDILRPQYSFLPRFRVTAGDWEILPDAGVESAVEPVASSVLVRVSFRPLVGAAVRWAASGRAADLPASEPVSDGDLVSRLGHELERQLSLSLTAARRADWAAALVRYAASGGAWEGLKAFAEISAGVETARTPGEYRAAWWQVLPTIDPGVAEWLTDRLVERVEASLPNPPAAGTLRRLAPRATAARVAEAFANPRNALANPPAFPIRTHLKNNPDWGLTPSRLSNMGPLGAFHHLCTERFVSPAGLPRPHLPWCAARAEGWRLAYDEAALCVISRLAGAGFDLAWASDRGVWVEVPARTFQDSVERVTAVAGEAVRAILGNLAVELPAAIGPAAA
jgi:hypothetical protein